MSRYTKDPDAKLDYAIDWTAWLAAVEDTISSATWTVPDGIAQAAPAPSVVDGKATIWLSGGTLGTSYTVTCHIVTAAGRTDDRSLTLTIRDR